MKLQSSIHPVMKCLLVLHKMAEAHEHTVSLFKPVTVTDLKGLKK